jgi:hypothetical protein
MIQYKKTTIKQLKPGDNYEYTEMDAKMSVKQLNTGNPILVRAMASKIADDCNPDTVVYQIFSDVSDTNDVEPLKIALRGLLVRYLELVNSGDAGYWDPELEGPVVAARWALKLHGVEVETFTHKATTAVDSKKMPPDHETVKVLEDCQAMSGDIMTILQVALARDDKKRPNAHQRLSALSTARWKPN